jgi:hypothetical protein
MIKRILKYNFAIIALLLLGSCNDDFLERYPLDQLSSETYWKTENDLINYNNGIYRLIRDDDVYPILMGMGKGKGLNYYEGIWWQDEMSDNLAPTTGRAKEFFQIRTGNFVVETKPRPTGWKGWELIRTINFGLENYDRGGIAPEISKKYKGEARLFRAWFYAEKVSKFGDLQWIDKVLNIDSEELYGSRDDREFVMDKVLEDLDYAIANLPADWEDGQYPGRVNKWVALAVKSRICLFEGTWRKYHGGTDPNKWLTECVNASKELMDNGGFEIYSTGNPNLDYRYMHWIENKQGISEVIYTRVHEGETNGSFQSRLFWNYNGGATKSFVEDFLCTDGKPISISDLYAGDDSIESVFENRDPRLRQCVLNPADKELLNYANDADSYPRITGQSGGRNKSNTGYHVVKHWNAVDELRPRHYHECTSPTLRLGEVLLNYAEAKAELGTITQADLDISINKLRDRVAMPHLGLNPPMDPRYANDGVSSLIIEIRRERRVELFLEGHRYNDIRRWKQGQKFADSDYGILWDEEAIARYPKANVQVSMVDGKPYIDVRKGTPFVPKWEDKFYLWPLPLSAIAQNPNLGQNPGWQ